MPKVGHSSAFPEDGAESFLLSEPAPASHAKLCILAGSGLS